MAKRIYEIGQTYGDYTLLKRESYKTSSGKTDKRLVCLNNKTGKEVRIHPSGLKKNIENYQKLQDIFDKGLYQYTYRKYLYRTYKKNAEIRNLNFDISFDEFNDLTSKNCVYCGSEPVVSNSERYKKSKQFTTDPDAKFNGIDRVDSSQGYTIDNCVPCCTKCNSMKLDYSKQEFLKHIEKIYKFNESSTTISKESTL